MLAMMTKHLDRLEILCNEVDATIRQLNDIRNGVIELDRAEDEDDLVDAAYDLWDELEGIVDGPAVLSDYERATRYASKEYGMLQDAIRDNDEDSVETFRSAYIGQMCLIEYLFATDRKESHVTDHAKVWYRAQDTIESLREELYNRH